MSFQSWRRQQRFSSYIYKKKCFDDDFPHTQFSGNLGKIDFSHPPACVMTACTGRLVEAGEGQSYLRVQGGRCCKGRGYRTPVRGTRLLRAELKNGEVSGTRLLEGARTPWAPARGAEEQRGPREQGLRKLGFKSASLAIERHSLK